MHAAFGEGKTLTVSYMPAKFAPSGEGEVCVLTRRAYKECSYRFRSHCTDEFRTTVVHHETITIMEEVGRLDTKQKDKCLQWCSSTNQT